MGAAFKKAAEPVRAESLHDADINVGIVVAEENFAIQLDKTGEAIEVMVEQLLAQVGRQVGLGIVQKRSDVVLQSALAAALIVDEEGIAIAQQDVAGLEVAIEEVIAGGGE